MICCLWNIICSILLILVLLNVSMTDIRYFRIPKNSYVILLFLSVIDAVLIHKQWVDCIFGFLSVSLGLIVIYILTHGNGIGGGDIKLMAVTGILLGWQRNILAFFVACILVAVHYIKNKNYFLRTKKFAFAPYLSIGILLSWFLGNHILQLYNQWL